MVRFRQLLAVKFSEVALDNLVLPQGLSYEISHIITPISLTDNNRLNFFLPALCIIS